MEKVNLLVGPDLRIIQRSFKIFKKEDVLEIDPKRLSEFLYSNYPKEKDVLAMIPYIFRGLSMTQTKVLCKLEKLTLINIERISRYVPNYFIQFFIFDEDFLYNEYLQNKKTSLLELIKINRINKLTVGHIKKEPIKNFNDMEKIIGVTHVSFWDKEAKEETSMYSRIA
jgi:hypothetical protein